MRKRLQNQTKPETTPVTSGTPVRTGRTPVGETVYRPWVPISLAQGREIGHLYGGRFEVAAGSNAEGIGAQIAQSLYGGLTR